MTIQPRPLDRTPTDFATFKPVRAGMVFVEGVSKFSGLFLGKTAASTFSSVMVPPRPSSDEVIVSF